MVTEFNIYRRFSLKNGQNLGKLQPWGAVFSRTYPVFPVVAPNTTKMLLPSKKVVYLITQSSTFTLGGSTNSCREVHVRSEYEIRDISSK